MRSLCFSDDAIFTAGEDGVVRAWRADSQAGVSEGGVLELGEEMMKQQPQIKKRREKEKEKEQGKGKGKGKHKPY